MARNYAALLHEYLEEMEMLSDAEFGRLCRALLKYSMKGEEEQLQGNERHHLKRVYMQERRFQKSYKDQVEAKRAAGKKGASARWQTMAEHGTPMAEHGENGKTETKTETETIILSSDDEKDKCARALSPSPSTADVGSVLADYLNRVNASASPRSLDELKGYAERMGPDVCKRAIDIALDEKKATWSYIRGILRSWTSAEVKSLSDIDQLDRQHVARKTMPKKSIGPTPGVGQTAPGEADRQAREDMERMRKMIGLDYIDSHGVHHSGKKKDEKKA